MTPSNEGMRIALINENSQAAKNSMIETALKNVVDTMGFEVKDDRIISCLLMKQTTI